MTTLPQDEVSAPRLNVFHFPSNTNFRFVLVLIAILGAVALARPHDAERTVTK